jgi:L-2-hydroxycarboxylate dehydrogenase (NAD+)
MVESEQLPEGTVRLDPGEAFDFVESAFRAAGIAEAHARLVAEVLVSADLRGIRSHGLARISYFLSRLERGTINATPTMRFERGSETTGRLLADDAIGIVAAERGMEEALSMAAEHGSGFVMVRDSSHFGYAGYWAMRAMERGCIGISCSSGGRRVAPTFGSESVFGTNPLSVTVPGQGLADDFVLDMATSAVAVGKVETALREGREVPPGWVAGDGPPSLDENDTLTYEYPLLPLGGAGDESGGHKGYGLSLAVELLAGALGMSSLDERIAGASGHERTAMGHFMGAISVAGFSDPAEIGRAMGRTFDVIRGSAVERGRDRILVHGEPERLAEAENRAVGIAVTPPVLSQLRRWNDHLGLGFAL